MNQAKAAGVGLLVIRIIVGLVMMYYGSQKLFGLFGGQGFAGTIQSFQDKNGIPPIFSALAMFGEFCGGLGLLLGLLTRVAAFGLMCTMAVAAFTQFRKPGLFDAILDGRLQDVNNAFYPLVIFSVAFCLLFVGGGPFTLEAKLMKGRKKAQA